jgi:LuxR family maltose regulon positive regulatory protein
VFAYKAAFLAENTQQKIIKIGAERLLASIALLKADTDGWQRAMSAIEQAAFGSAQNTSVFRAVLDVVRGTLLSELRDYSRIPDWIKNAEHTSLKLPISLVKNAMAVHLLYLMGNGDFARLIGFLQAVQIEKLNIFSEYFHYFLFAVGFSSLGDRAKATDYLERSAGKALPDGMIHYFAAFSRLLRGLSDEVIENSYPHLLAHFKDYKDQYIAGWYKLHNAFVADELPSGLTEREREIAELAADGLRNNEIAEMLYVSENTVRAHLRAIYQKLDIDRRAKLAKRLK